MRKNSSINNIFDSVIKQDLCVGCGACLYSDLAGEFSMNWNIDGFLVPVKNNNSTGLVNLAIEYCPFNPNPLHEIRTENELAGLFLKDAPNHHSKIGRYFNIYVGYSKQFRLTSSSGGIATYILNELFEKRFIDAVITVAEGINNHYEYKFVKRKEDLLATSKTKYYPVTMADALKELNNFEGKVAIVGIGCFIKAIRLVQYYNPKFQDKIVFTVGIICGGLKSRFFSEYLAAKAGVNNCDFTKPQFRIKDVYSTAGDYSFGCIDNDGVEKKLRMRSLGDMWGSGMFKCNACDFCDDVTTELADISLGDAWLNPYSVDGKGTNVIIVRSNTAQKILEEGNESSRIHLEALKLDTLINSQRGSYNHRHIGLPYRIKLAKKKGAQIPPKRYLIDKSWFDFKVVQRYRILVRKKSLKLWQKYYDSVMFDHKLEKTLFMLQKSTLVYHYIRLKIKKNQEL